MGKPARVPGFSTAQIGADATMDPLSYVQLVSSLAEGLAEQPVRVDRGTKRPQLLNLSNLRSCLGGGPYFGMRASNRMHL